MHIFASIYEYNSINTQLQSKMEREGEGRRKVDDCGRSILYAEFPTLPLALNMVNFFCIVYKEITAPPPKISIKKKF